MPLWPLLQNVDIIIFILILSFSQGVMHLLSQVTGGQNSYWTL
jgi:hypothetical protein